MKRKHDLKYLFIDIELSYAVGYFFPSKKPQYIPAKNIKDHQFCPCAAWKWRHETTTYAIKLTDNKKRFKHNYKDDYIIAKKLHSLMKQADVIIAHNGDEFDIKHLNMLFRKHKLGPIPEKKSIDTLKLARKYFRFPGNGLSDLLTLFGYTGKVGKPDWIKLTKGQIKQIGKATSYCIRDVQGLEKVFNELAPYARRLPALREPYGIITKCHACGSKRIHKHSGDAFDGTRMYSRYICNSCHHTMRGKANEKRKT